MPKSSTPSLNDLIKKRNLRAETKDKEAEPPKAGGSSLPAGIDDGIAKVTMIKFPIAKSGTYQGQPMLYSHATLIEPAEFDVTLANGKVVTKNLAGAMVQFRSINICDTTSSYGEEYNRTLEENWAKAENHLKLLGIPTEDIDDDELEETVTQYPETEDLYVRFRTWANDPSDGEPNPRVNVVLEGVAEGYVQEVVDDMDDDTEAVEKPTPKKDTKKPTTKAAKKTTPKKESKKVDPLDALAKKADDDDDASSQEELTRLATEAGIDIGDLDTWQEGANAIREAQAAGDGDGEVYEDVEAPEPAAASDYVPKKDDIVSYTPEGEDDAVECEVTRVIKTKKVASLVALEDEEEVYKNVPWDSLTPSE